MLENAPLYSIRFWGFIVKYKLEEFEKVVGASIAPVNIGNLLWFLHKKGQQKIKSDTLDE